MKIYKVNCMCVLFVCAAISVVMAIGTIGLTLANNVRAGGNPEDNQPRIEQVDKMERKFDLEKYISGSEDMKKDRELRGNIDFKLDPIPGVSYENLQNAFKWARDVGARFIFMPNKRQITVQIYSGRNITNLKNWKQKLATQVLSAYYFKTKPGEEEKSVYSLTLRPFLKFVDEYDGMMVDKKGNCLYKNEGGKVESVTTEQLSKTEGYVTLHKDDESKVRVHVKDFVFVGREEVRAPVKIPEIKFEKNPESRSEVVAKGKQLEAFKNELLEGVDMSKVEGTDEYKKVMKSINQLLADEQVYVYLKNAKEVQLKSVEIQIEEELQNLFSLIQKI